MSTPQTVSIVGGVLAGLSLGIALRRAQVPAVIFEAGDYPRHRVCGEFITGLDEVTIEKLGIGEAFAGADSHRQVTWFLSGNAFGRHVLPSPARALSRFALDARLANLFVAEGGTLEVCSRIPAPPTQAGWVIAAGRNPCVSSSWIGLKFHVRHLASSEGLELHLGKGAYVGVSSVENGWINVCGLFRSRPELRFERHQALPAYLRAAGLHALADRLLSAQIRPDSIKAMAGIRINRRLENNEGVNLGDASAMIPPFTGNGMAMAFTAARLAFEPLVAWSKRELSWDEAAGVIHRALHREFRMRLNAAMFLHPFLLNPGAQACLAGAARTGILPFGSLYRLLH